METQNQSVATTLEDFIEVIGSISESDFNKIPFEGSWTAGQVAEHIRLSAGSIGQLLEGNTEPTSRNPDEKVGQIRDIFLDMDTKMKSPESIDPPIKTYDRNRFIEFFKKLKEDLVKAESSLDLSLICLDFEVPGFGPMTRLEWIAFVNFHTQRHVIQMKNIRAKVNG